MAKARTITIEIDGASESVYRDLALATWMQAQLAASAGNFRFKIKPDNGQGFVDRSFLRELDKLWERYGRETRFSQ